MRLKYAKKCGLYEPHLGLYHNLNKSTNGYKKRLEFLGETCMRCFYREQKWICGDYMDVDIYPVWTNLDKGRRKRIHPTSEIQKKLNERNAQNKLTRLVHTNFKWYDYEAGLDYEVQPMSEEDAIKDIQKFFRKARKLYLEIGKELKYIWVMEKGKQSGRIHFHVILPGGVDRTVLEELWGHGYANTKSLQFRNTGVKGLCCYNIKDSLRQRRWSCSKNLIKPVPEKDDYKMTRKKVRRLCDNSDVRDEFEKLYPGYRWVDCERAFYDHINGGYYITARFYRKGAKIL